MPNGVVVLGGWSCFVGGHWLPVQGPPEVRSPPRNNTPARAKLKPVSGILKGDGVLYSFRLARGQEWLLLLNASMVVLAGKDNKSTKLLLPILFYTDPKS